MQLIIFEKEEDIEFFLNRQRFQHFFNLLRERGRFKEVYVTSKNGACSSLERRCEWDVFDGGTIKKDDLDLSSLTIRQIVKLASLCNYTLPSYEVDKYRLLKEKLKEVRSSFQHFSLGCPS